MGSFRRPAEGGIGFSHFVEEDRPVLGVELEGADEEGVHMRPERPLTACCQRRAHSSPSAASSPDRFCLRLKIEHIRRAGGTVSPRSRRRSH